MITLKNGCKARNLQEQVAYNQVEIERLKHFVGDAYLEIDDTELTHTGTLTSDMKKVLDAYEIVYVILKQATDLYQVFRTDYYEQKFRKCAFFVGGSLHKLDLDYDNSTWYYSEQSIGRVQVQSDYAQTDTTQVDYIKNKPTIPTKTSELTNDSGFLTSHQDISGKQNVIEYVTLASASGTISSADLTKLQASKDNKIILDNEIYILMDNKTADGYLAYSHIEKESTQWKVKTITITISTKAWILVEAPLLDTDLEKIYRQTKISDENKAVAFHNSVPGGKDITSYVTDGTLWKRIAGSDGFTLFEGLFVGDYWKMTEKIRSRQDNNGISQTNEGTDYVMIAGFDTMWGNGEDSYKVSYHHIVCIPGKPDGSTMLAFGQHRMNETNTSANGYKNTQLHSTVIGSPTTTAKRFSTYNTATINEQLYAEFGAHLATTHELLSNGMQTSRVNRWGEATGGASGWEWVSCQAVLMSEVEVYGSIAVSSTAHDVGNAKAQLPVFRFFPQALSNRSCWYWLKAISGSPGFCSVGGHGDADFGYAGNAVVFVRPRFVLKA